MNQHILVTGGAGYIGSVVASVLLEAGYRVTIVDHAPVESVPAAIRDRVTYLAVDYVDALVQQYCASNTIAAVIHLAAFIEVGESVQDPARYYHNNVLKTVQLLDIVRGAQIPVFLFASSSAVYAPPAVDEAGHIQPLREEHTCTPVSPYGRTKLMVEWILRDYEQAYGIRYGALRLCNVAGALPALGLGECHTPESHLIPRALAAAATQTEFVVSGSDYPTPDGSCVRDFVHVYDVAQAYCALLRYLFSGGNSIVCTIGSGRGSSVREVLSMIEKTTQRALLTVHGARRAGDPAQITADIMRARTLLQWEPQMSDLEQIITSASEFYFQ